ncbi:adenylate/guanylate cyclase domain-containing protein [Sneathiella sp.]|uniref:adenylate/guanylate cyclase domain-containing protein n=1 Tax=Sneathiella sp. TaxID=1964365 RepID=UPI003568E8F6
MNSEVDRKLTAILCADVCGYSRLMNNDEDDTLTRLKITRDIFRGFIDQYGGRIVNMTGDGLVGEFASVVKAVQCAVEVQNKINADNADLPTAYKMLYRIGINLGDVIIEGDDIFGEGVNVAARMEALAPAGGICISGIVFDQVKNKLPRHFEFLGNKTVKNIAQPIPVYSLALTESPEVFPAEAESHVPNVNPSGKVAKDHDDDARIRRYVRRQAGFYRRAITFGTIILFLFIINALSSSSNWWVLWPAASFACLLLVDAIRIFAVNNRTREWEERKISQLKSRKPRT